MPRMIFVGLVIFILFLFLSSALDTSQSGSTSLNSARQKLLSTQAPWARGLVDHQNGMQGWLARYGSDSEESLFAGLSELLFRSAINFSEISGESSAVSFFHKIALSLHFGLLRIGFIVIACTRIWLLAMIVAAIWAARSLRVNEGTDFLGRSGNGRLFYSGIRVDVSEVNQQGLPRHQLTGLACPQRESEAKTKASNIVRVLEKFNALNETNLGLAAVVLKQNNYPAYVTKKEEQNLLEKAFSGASLPDQASRTLEKALSLHAAYCGAQSIDQLPDWSESQRQRLAQLGGEQPLSASDYASFLAYAFDRCITSTLREPLTEVSPAQLATVVLAYEAGKVMAYGEESPGRWVKKSNFSQLCARSVLHALPGFSRDYDYDQRTVIRRALIYGSRTSIAAPVRFPADFDQRSRALRQWVELLMACPHELAAVSDEVELFALITESHQLWSQAFFDRVLMLDPAVVQGVFATHGNSFFMPLSAVVNVFREILPENQLTRIEELAALVSQRQMLETMSIEAPDEKSESNEIEVKEKLHRPLSNSEMQELAKLHDLSIEQMKNWSAIRLILHSYGWLGKRVGDNSVPSSFVIFSVFNLGEGYPGANELGLFGLSGMVPFRATRLAAQWGKHWQSRFQQVESASMAENVEDFERLMSGLPTKAEEEAAAVVGNSI